MAEKEIQFRKKRETGEIIADTFAFLKQEFRPLAKIVLIYVIPFIILYAALQVDVQRKLLDSGIMNDPSLIMNNPGPFYKNVIIILLFNVFVQALFIAAVYSYIEMYIKEGKGNFTLHEVTSRLFHNSLLALGAGVALTVIVVLGLMMFIVPGIYFANTLSLSVMILIFEKKGLNHALTRSWKLVNSLWWNNYFYPYNHSRLYYICNRNRTTGHHKLPGVVLGHDRGECGPLNVVVCYSLHTACLSVFQH